ncbi:MAG TPA: SH3 domain-containing protein [Ruminiclostridium sp.]|nr:SH3 domain-containing protein [Ruminiclostridium sp.]
MKIIKAILCLSLCAFLIIGNVPTQASGATVVKPTVLFDVPHLYWVNVDPGSYLYVRSGPGTNYNQIDALPRSKYISCDGTNSSGTWYHMLNTSFQSEGWVSGSYIVRSAD